MNAETLSKIWIMGIAAWGSLWTKTLGDSPIDDDGKPTIPSRLWRNQLDGYDPNTVMKALANLSGTLKYPPSLAELKGACKDQSAEQLRIAPPRQDANHRMYHGQISARSAFNESVAENCKAFNARCKEYGFDHTDHNY